MSMVLLSAQNGQVRDVIEAVDLEAEKKLEIVLSEAIAKTTASSPVNISNVYFTANEIAMAAFTDFENWAAKTFTASPSKEIAQAWVNGNFHRFGGSRSIQKDIRQILSK